MFAAKKKVLCLDWDARSLRLVVARVGSGSMELEDAHSHRVPQDIDAGDPQAMGGFIKAKLEQHRLRAKHVVVDVPRERTVINRMTLPPTPAADVAAAVRFQAMRELPFSLESAALDYVVTKQDEKGLTTEVLLAAVMNDTLHRLRDTCLAAGLMPTRIGLRPYANLVAAMRVTDLKGRRVMFIDVGPGATEIDVFDGESLAFARSANVTVPVPVRKSSGGNPEDSRIISLAEIATLEDSGEAIDAAVDELLVEVTRTLQAYRATQADVTIDSVIAAGGTGIEEQLADALYDRLGVPVDLFDPTGPLGVEGGEAVKLRSFAASLGLAWGLSRESLLALDFLNPKQPVSQREVLRQKIRTAGMAAAAVLVLAAGALGSWYYRLARELNQLTTANAKLQSEVDARVAIQIQIDRADDWQIDAVWPDELLAISRAAIEPGKKMLVRSINMRADSNEQKIKLRTVQVTDWQIPTEYIRTLNETTTGDDRRFQAAQGPFQVVASGEFRGKIDIDVEMTHVAKAMADAQKREADRKHGRIR